VGIVDSRYILSALAGLFAAASIFAVATTIRHISHEQVIAEHR